MSREVVWRYIYAGGVKHALYGAPPRGMSHRSARCGVGPQWFDPRGWLGAWGDEVAELDRRQPCKRCIDNLKRDRVPS